MSTKQEQYMKVLSGLLIMACILIASCKDTDRGVNVATNQEMRKILKQEYPSLNKSQIRIEVEEFKDVIILLGDEQLYAKSDEELEEVTDNIARITYDKYIDNNYLDKGKIIFTPIETRLINSDDPTREFSFNYEDYAPEEE